MSRSNMGDINLHIAAWEKAARDHRQAWRLCGFDRPRNPRRPAPETGECEVSKFRKKPVEIEAEQWFPDRTIKGVHWERQSGDDGEFLVPYVITIHDQRAYLAPGDWVIPEPKEGHYYPCKPDIFAATYDEVTA